MSMGNIIHIGEVQHILTTSYNKLKWESLLLIQKEYIHELLDSNMQEKTNKVSMMKITMRNNIYFTLC